MNKQAQLRKKVVDRYGEIVERHGVFTALDRGMYEFTLKEIDENSSIKLDYQLLLNCQESSLSHDMHGIKRYYDHFKHDFRDHFLPRCVVHEEQE